MINLLFIFSKCKLQLGIWAWIMQMHIQFNIKSPSLSLLNSLIWFSISYRYKFVWNAFRLTDIKAPRNSNSIFYSPKDAKHVEWMHQVTVILVIGSQIFREWSWRLSYRDIYSFNLCIISSKGQVVDNVTPDFYKR